LECHDSWPEASFGILPQLEHQIVVEENFVDEAALVGVAVEENWENLVVVDLRTELRIELLLERRLLVESLPELKLLEFLMLQDVLSD
jgi:hypothetical protein